MKAPYFILEVANTHNGNLDYVHNLIDEFKHFKEVGMKFQPFKYDCLAEQDYKGFELYKKLFFECNEWASIISLASETKDVWLDMFDDYSVKILTENLSKIRGIKLQASVLGNFNLLQSLRDIDLTGKEIILNVSGFELNEINLIIKELSEITGIQPIIQLGFQSHPTKFEHSGLVKILYIKKEFPDYKISFADHLSNSDDQVLNFPIIASLLGASVIEKHIMSSVRSTTIDYYSSITSEQFEWLSCSAYKYQELLNKDFMNDFELKYLESSMLVPVVSKEMFANDYFDFSKLLYKRTSKSGLTSFQIRELIKSGFSLNQNKSRGETFNENDFRKKRIGAVVICRMKSTRLPKKALLKVGSLATVELCIKNTLEFEGLDEVILATSVNPDDQVLKDYTYRDDVRFFAGSEDDVIDRLIRIGKEYNLDVIVRITGDSPFRSKELFKLLLESHFITGADYTAAEGAPIGTNIELINLNALERVFELFNGTPYSEYLSYYFKNNPNYFKLNIVEVPLQFKNDFRLTLDYPEDYDLFLKIEEKFGFSQEPFNTFELFDFLKNNPTISSINKNCNVAYTEDSELLKLIIDKTTLKSTSL